MVLMGLGPSKLPKRGSKTDDNDVTPRVVNSSEVTAGIMLGDLDEDVVLTTAPSISAEMVADNQQVVVASGQPGAVVVQVTPEVQNGVAVEGREAYVCHACRPITPQMSLPSIESNVDAIRVRHAFKSYGSRRRIVVMEDLNMTVKSSSMYGLLGPSGAGKTTLLHCIVGLTKLDKGFVRIYGKTPRDPTSAFPASILGYMPQQAALNEEFTIKEELAYYGYIYSIPSVIIKERTKFLLDFLKLPTENFQLIGRMSGGQQRRVSLAIALLHKPQLLILDEPTVGVDPLLRAKIWEHLQDLTRNEGTTIVITTHYMEEICCAQKVAMMRSGKIVVEAAPLTLMRAFNAVTLSDAFLKVCQSDRADADTAAALHSVMPDDAQNKEEENSATTARLTSRCVDKCSRLRHLLIPQFGHLRALLMKNFLQFFRRPIDITFQILVAALQIAIFFWTVGRKPSDVPIAIVNDATSLCDLDPNLFPAPNSSCWPFLPPRCAPIPRHLEVIRIVYYDNEEQVMSDVEDGRIFGMIRVHDDGGSISHLIKTLQEAKNTTSVTPERLSSFFDGWKSTKPVTIRFDNSDPMKLLYVKEELLKDITRCLNHILGGFPMPIVEGTPFYGEEDVQMLYYMAPGVIVCIIYFMAVGMTTSTLVAEKRNNLLDRAMVSGVRPMEVILALLVTQLTVMIAQCTLILAISFAFFKVPNEGRIGLVILLVVIQGLSGMCFGLLISSAVRDEKFATVIVIGFVLPVLLLSGLFWPRDTMIIYFYYISNLIPQSWAIDGLREVMFRGQGIHNVKVFLGLSVPIAWSLVFIVFASIFLRFR